MGDILVKGADLTDGRIARLRVAIDRLPERVVERDIALKWLTDGHSLVPFAGGRLPALQRVEVGEEGVFIRSDNEPVSADALPPLPPAG
jgi:hypothetical protein